MVDLGAEAQGDGPFGHYGRLGSSSNTGKVWVSGMSSECLVIVLVLTLQQQ